MKNIKSVTLSQAVQLIYGTKGKIFTANFIKKDGTFRQMNCRLGVTKGVTGKGLKFEPVLHQLLPVYDMQNKGYRMINIKNLLSLKINGSEYTVNPWGE